MKKCLILLSLLGLHLSLHAQSKKWSAGYRLGLVHEEAFRNSSNAASNISNQVFVGYRILKRLELEAGLQHNPTSYSNGGTDEMFRIRPDYTFNNFKAKVFRLSLDAKFSFFNQRPTSVYALAGLSGAV
ncbi:porin family protein [Taibaiella helva]|uniref:outer membrane beta-barrel protein n=1 Tax=Taibaiella helva TaxID=2301235 RepID=UPI000E572058|nr:outer membrane beta-barrel protein [Taibaiella helva]